VNGSENPNKSRKKQEEKQKEKSSRLRCLKKISGRAGGIRPREFGKRGPLGESPAAGRQTPNRIHSGKEASDAQINAYQSTERARVGGAKGGTSAPEGKKRDRKRFGPSFMKKVAKGN